jgi:sulfoacetaldehyde dehydrogenase
MLDDKIHVEAEVAELVARARHAQLLFEAYDQQRVDEVVTALGWAIVEESNNRLLAEQAVQETGLGNVADKMIKNRRKTMGLLRDLKGARSVGVIGENRDLGLVEIARPVGVVAAIVPSTNPAATPANKIINAIKGRNAIIVAPSPKGQGVCETLIGLMHRELDRVDAPRDLVQKLPSPVNKLHTHELMRQADLIVATGSQNNVRAAYSSGTPAIGVGAGNVVSIIDETADLSAAATRVVASKAFDNATSCSSENNLIVVDSVYDECIRAFAAKGAHVLEISDKELLGSALWQGGRLNGSLIARSAIDIAATLGIDVPTDTKVLLVEETGTGAEFPFSGEKLSPVLTVYRARDFEHAARIARDILDYEGKGHSIGIHSSNHERPLWLGLNLPVCRVIVNQAHAFATGGSFDNGLPFSLSMGCGTWGGNSISDNMNYRHYLNITRISRAIAANEPTLEQVFGTYWRSHRISDPSE